MKNHHFLFIIIVGSLLYGIFLWSEYRQTDEIVGQVAPNFTLQDEAGNKVSLTDHRGKVVLVHFWATWCPTCLDEIPLLDQLQKQFSSSPFVLLAISEDESFEDIEKFRKKVPFDFPVYLDEMQKATDAYGTYRFPESYLVDKEGIIVKKFVGPQNWDQPIWRAKIHELL